MVASRRSDETREALVAAAIDTLRELSAAQLITAIGTRGIAQRAGVSGATLFYQFGSIEAFAQAVVERVYDPEQLAVDPVKVDLVDMAGSGSPLSAALAHHRSMLTRWQVDREHRLRVGLWAFGGSAAIEAYGNYVRVADAKVVAAAERLYEAWGREARPPYDLTTFVALHAALLSGSTIRSTIDTAIDHESFSHTAIGLSTFLLRDLGDSEDVDARLAEINDYGRRARWSPSAVNPAAGTRDTVITSAVATLDRLGHAATTIAAVAEAAHVSESTVYAMFRSRAGLDIAVLERLAESLTSQLPTGDVPPHEWLRAALVALARFLISHRDLVSVYLTALVSGAPALECGCLLAHVETVVRTARDRGDVRSTVVPSDVAPTLLLALASRVVRQPAEGAESSVDHVAQLCLDGLSNEAAVAPL